MVNGTWSDQGTKWSDPSNGVTVPFSCGGKIAPMAAASGVDIEATRNASGFELRLALSDELTNNPPGICPEKSEAQYLYRVGANVYQTEFSIPKSQMGQKTIVRQVSGPMAKHRSDLAGACSDNADGCSFNMTWHGVVHLTRTRTTRIKY